jgi:hypothetical protein
MYFLLPRATARLAPDWKQNRQELHLAIPLRVRCFRTTFLSHSILYYSINDPATIQPCDVFRNRQPRCTRRYLRIGTLQFGQGERERARQERKFNDEDPVSFR